MTGSFRVRYHTHLFDFASVYGPLGEGFIHVHHSVPIGTIKEEYKIDPKTDLTPVCPNCHAMIHRAEPPLGVEELRNHVHQTGASSAGSTYD